jgi:DHA1 family bicyclomycin/chloramphenicol resistance-like MFS transporter
VQIVSASSHDLIRNYGLLLVVIGTTCAALWLIVRHRSFVAGNISQS